MNISLNRLHLQYFLGFSLVVLSFPCLAWKQIDFNQLPSLNQGDISFTNNLDSEGVVSFKPNRCSETGFVVIQSGESRKIACSGAESVQIRFFYKRQESGPLEERVLDVPASAHYSFGLDLQNPPGLTAVDIFRTR